MSTMTLNKKTFRIAGLLLILCLITAAILSGTFAKYTSEYFGQDTALVAKWDLTIKAGDTEFTGDGEQELDLFKHAYDKNIVAGAGDDKIIAPGVDGEFVLSMTNNSDVAAAIEFSITEEEDNAEVPMEYKVDNGEWVDFDGLATALDNELDGTLAVGSDEKTVNVLWRWAYERGDDETAITSNDATDTGLGEVSAEGETRTSYKLNIAITATQAKPATEE